MARKPHVPSYRRHRQSGQAIVCLVDAVTKRRKDRLLGPYGSAASKAEYKRLIVEWEANGRLLPDQTTDYTIPELIQRFWAHVTTYYRHSDGSPTGEVQCFTYALRPLKYLHKMTVAKDFGPSALKTVRELMVRGYNHPKFGPQPPICRTQINARVKRIRRMFRWAVENELVPPGVLHGLQAVQALKRGRTEARESDPVQPVARAVVEATLPHMPSIVADMVQLQLETGMRPGELVTMRACDIDMTGKVWLYRPSRHKTEHHGHARVVPIGPRGQAIVRRNLKVDTQAFLFTPADSMAEFRAMQRRKRKTKVQPSQHDRRKARPKKAAGARYMVTSYGRAIAYACEKAFLPPEHLLPRLLANGKRETKKAWRARLTDQEMSELKAWRKEHRWHPHQLRHTRALELKREAGLDVARAVLGHRSPVITEHYATLDMVTASEAMARLG